MSSVPGITLRARVWQGLQVLFFPQSCVLCGRWVANPDASPLCAECFLQLPRFRNPLCPNCGGPAPAGISPFPDRETSPGAPEPCASCRGMRSFHHSTRAWGPYTGTLRKLIHRFKFSGHRRLAHPLACLLEEAYRKRPNPFSPSCLVPVPSHPRRLRKRGFDQTLLLTRTLGRRLNLPLFRGLRRSRPTLPQFGLDLKARRRNVRNAFRLRQAQRLKDEDLILVDDILTTGATVREICKVLKRNGRAGRILVLTVARVTLPGETPEAASRSGGVLAAEERRHPCRRLDRRQGAAASLPPIGSASRSGGIPAADWIGVKERRRPRRRLDRRLSGADQGSQGGRQSPLQPTPRSEMQAHLIEVRILELEPGIGSGESHGPR